MGAPTFTRKEFAHALAALLPRGPAWAQNDEESTQYKTCAGLSRVYVRNTNRAAKLLVDAFPATSVELLPEWEATLGLPDPCSGPAPTIAARQQQVVAKLVGLGVANAQAIVEYLEALGYTVTITQFTPWSVDMPVDYPMYGLEWAHAWQINAPLETITYFTVLSGVDEPLSAFGNEVLECIAEAIAQAHTVVIFNYE
jgi:uncharacterized protein YmfQ (DUF2313 family)